MARDPDRIQKSVVALRAEIPEEGFTAQILGTERAGNGVVIRADGLVLTIGYLITEANAVWLTTHAGAVVAAHPLAYDQPTGFGLVMSLGPLGVPALERGSSVNVQPGDQLLAVGHGGHEQVVEVEVVAKREFAGYWEYLLDEALFTAPVHPQWAGAALVDNDARLIGIGSLMVQEPHGDKTVDSNMFVPIDLLDPILEDLVTRGRAARLPRPWLGVYTAEMSDHIVVGGLSAGGPAEQAGVRLGDVIVEAAGQRVSKLAELFRTVWAAGPAGTEIPLVLVRGREVSQVRVRSIDRNDLLRKPRAH